MSINLYSFSSNALNSFSSHDIVVNFKEIILPFLAEQKMKIIVIASIAFAILAALYVAKNWYYKNKKEDGLMTPIEKEKEKEVLAYMANRKIQSEEDPEKIDQMFLWVLSHTERSNPETKTLMQQFIADAAKKSEKREMYEADGAYIRWIETLNPEQQREYFQLLPIEGDPPPLFYHLQKEHQAAKLTSKSSSKTIGERIKILFSLITPAHANTLINFDHFWNLLYLYPEEAAASLKPEVLAIFAKNKQRHTVELNKLVPRLPEKDELYDKLNALASHASPQIEFALKLKGKRLIQFDFLIQGSPATMEEKKALKKKLNQNIKKGLENHRLEKQNDTADSFKTPSKYSPAKKWVKEVPKTAPQVPLVIKPKPQWPEDQCLSFLKEKRYILNENLEAEEIVFDWILNQECLFDEENSRSELIAFIRFTLSKSTYIETTKYRLQEMSGAQLRFFVKLLGKESIEILWTLEAQHGGFSLTYETNKISRLKTALVSLSEEQLHASIQSEKFLELLRTHAKILGPLLTPAQWGAIAARKEREEEVLKTLTHLASNIETDVDPKFAQKLHIISGILKKRKESSEKAELREALRHEIERNLLLCPPEINEKISAILSQD